MKWVYKLVSFPRVTVFNIRKVKIRSLPSGDVSDIFHLTAFFFASDPTGKAFNVNAVERFTKYSIYIMNMAEVALNFERTLLSAVYDIANN